MPLKEPWISVNPNLRRSTRRRIDVRIRVYAFYKQLIALRHDMPVVAAGDWHLLDADDAHVYAFTRTLGDEKLLVVVNMSGRTVDLPRETAELAAAGITESNVVISTYDARTPWPPSPTVSVDPWEAAVIQL